MGKINRKLTKEDCVIILRQKQEEISKRGETRFPKRSDFGNDEVVAIKAFLGPWPRALEAAGLKLKPVCKDDKQERIIKKRIETKRRKTQEKISRKFSASKNKNEPAE